MLICIVAFIWKNITTALLEQMQHLYWDYKVRFLLRKIDEESNEV